MPPCILAAFASPFHVNQGLVAPAQESWHHKNANAGADLHWPGTCPTFMEGTRVRYLYIGLIVVFAGLVLLFKFQNLETVTISLFAASMTLSVSILVFGIYVLGMLTGGFVLALLRTWVRRARSSG